MQTVPRIHLQNGFDTAENEPPKVSLKYYGCRILRGGGAYLTSFSGQKSYPRGRRLRSVPIRWLGTRMNFFRHHCSVPRDRRKTRAMLEILSILHGIRAGCVRIFPDPGDGAWLNRTQRSGYGVICSKSTAQFILLGMQRCAGSRSAGVRSCRAVCVASPEVWSAFPLVHTINIRWILLRSLYYLVLSSTTSTSAGMRSNRCCLNPSPNRTDY